MGCGSDKPNIIIDAGSGYVKAGFSGEEGPRTVFPNLVGRPKVPGIMVGGELPDFFVGPQAAEKRGVLILNSPVEHGIIEDWDDWEKVMEYTFTDELRVVPEEHCVLLTEPPLNPKVNREKMTQIMFDTFNVPGLYIGISSALTMYAAGKFTGLVVEIGDSVAHIVPVADGYALPHSTLRLNLAGRDLTDYLVKLLSDKGVRLTTSAERELVRGLKEQCCYVALDFEGESNKSKRGGTQPRACQLPDGTKINLNEERFRCPELLFQPSLAGRDFSGLHDHVFQSIQKCDVDVRRDLYQNIVLAGGSTLFPGLPERLTKEVQKLVPKNISTKVNVVAIPERKNCAWIGGSILSEVSTFEPMWITKEEYQEAGPSIVHRKCF